MEAGAGEARLEGDRSSEVLFGRLRVAAGEGQPGALAMEALVGEEAEVLGALEVLLSQVESREGLRVQAPQDRGVLNQTRDAQLPQVLEIGRAHV